MSVHQRIVPRQHVALALMRASIVVPRRGPPGTSTRWQTPGIKLSLPDFSSCRGWRSTMISVLSACTTDLPLVSTMRKVANAAFCSRPRRTRSTASSGRSDRSPGAGNALGDERPSAPLCHSRLARSPRNRASGSGFATRTVWRSEVKRRVEANEGRFKQTR